MDIVTARNKTLTFFEKIRNSTAFLTIYDVLTKRLLFFSLLAIFAAVSASYVMGSLSISDYLLYYSLPQAPGEFRPNTLFGIMNFSFNDFDNISMILKAAYLVLLLTFTFFSYILIKRADAKGRKFEAFAGLLTVLIITITSSENVYISNFLFNQMFSLTLIIVAAAALTTLKTRYIPLVVVLVSAAQLIDCRSIILVVPISAVTFFSAKLTCGDPARLRAMCISAFAASVTVLVITQIISVNTVTDLEAVNEYILNNQAPDMKLQYVDIQKWYTASPLTWISFYIPPIYTDYGLFRLFFSKNNFVLLAIAFTLAYIIKAARRPFADKGMPQNKIDELKQSLTSILTLNNGGGYGKVFVLFCLTAIFYVDIISPGLPFSRFLLMGFCAAVIFFTEKKRITLSDKFDKPAFFRISVALLISKYLIYTITYSNLSHYDFVIDYVSYQNFGLIPRGLFGSILYAIFGYHLYPNIVLYIATAMKMLILFLFILYLYRNFKRTNSDTEHSVIGMLSLLFMFSPAFSFLFYPDNICKTVDVMFIVIGIVCIDIAVRNRQLVWFIPILSTLCVFIHQVYISMFFPAVFIILVYRAFVDDRGHRVRNTVVTLITLVLTAAAFFYFMFFYVSTEGVTSEDYLNIIYGRSFEQGIENVKNIILDIINDIFIIDGMEHVVKTHAAVTRTQTTNLIFAILMNLPLLLGFFYMLKHSSSKEKKLLPKLGYLAMGLSVLAAVFPFISDYDTGRWWGFVMMMIILVMIKVTKMQPEEKKWYKDIRPETLKRSLALMIVLASLFPTISTNLFFMYMLHM